MNRKRIPMFSALVVLTLVSAAGSADPAAQLRAADSVRAGMPADVAAALAAFGHEFDGDIARQTAAIYARVPRV